MASKDERRPLRGDFNLGGEQAEADPLLEVAFYDSGKFASILNRTNPHCFLIGRTGSGKTAILQHLEDMEEDHVIRINPEDLSLPYLLDLNVVRKLSELEVHLDPFFIALWKHVLLVEVIRHRYQIDTPGAKRNILETLKDRVKRDPSKQAALDYFDEFGESFWCETDQRVKEITENFSKSLSFTSALQAELPGVAKAAAEAEVGRTLSRETRSEEADRYQRIVNETQLARLNKMIAVLDDDILESDQNFTYVVIDDLDRDWIDDQVANDLIRCLFRAVLDLQRVRNLKIVVALRTNIFEQLNFGSRTGGQEEKFRSLQIQMKWTRGELKNLADERAKAASELGEPKGITKVTDFLPSNNRDGSKPFDYILDRTLLRPRDAIAFLNECLTHASGQRRLRWSDLDTAEATYSHQRLLALRDEWKSNYPGIEEVFNIFKGCASAIPKEQLGVLLTDVALLISDPDFPGVTWMTELGEPLWDESPGDDWVDKFQPLVAFLYNLGFLGVLRHGEKPQYSYDSPDYASRHSNLEKAAGFMVHPTFHLALDIT